MYGVWEKMINLDAVGWASWVQAIGSVIAILASGFIASWQARNQFASALRLQKYNEFKNNTINLVAINASMTHLNGIFGELLADIREQIKPTKGKSKLTKGTYKIAKRPYYKNELETAYSDISKIMIQELQSADLINSYIKIRSRIWQFLNLSAIQIGEELITYEALNAFFDDMQKFQDELFTFNREVRKQTLASKEDAMRLLVL